MQIVLPRSCPETCSRAYRGTLQAMGQQLQQRMCHSRCLYLHDEAVRRHANLDLGFIHISTRTDRRACVRESYMVVSRATST
jgi:hypothetical protein